MSRIPEPVNLCLVRERKSGVDVADFDNVRLYCNNTLREVGEITALLSFLPLPCFTLTKPVCISTSSQFNLQTSARLKPLSARNNKRALSRLLLHASMALL